MITYLCPIPESVSKASLKLELASCKLGLTLKGRKTQPDASHAEPADDEAECTKPCCVYTKYFVLPPDALTDQIQATVSEGVLKVVAPLRSHDPTPIPINQGAA